MKGVYLESLSGKHSTLKYLTATIPTEETIRTLVALSISILLSASSNASDCRGSQQSSPVCHADACWLYPIVTVGVVNASDKSMSVVDRFLLNEKAATPEFRDVWYEVKSETGAAQTFGCSVKAAAKTVGAPHNVILSMRSQGIVGSSSLSHSR